MGELPNIDPEFIVIFGSAWCNSGGIGISYSWDGDRFNNRNDAIKHGLRTRGSDDFNIGQTYGDDLIWFGWMDQRMDEDEDTMREISENIGLTFDPRWYAYEYSKATGRLIGLRSDIDAEFDHWIGVLETDVIQGEYGYEPGEFSVTPANWRPLFDEKLSPADAFKRALNSARSPSSPTEGEL